MFYIWTTCLGQINVLYMDNMSGADNGDKRTDLRSSKEYGTFNFIDDSNEIRIKVFQSITAVHTHIHV